MTDIYCLHSYINTYFYIILSQEHINISFIRIPETFDICTLHLGHCIYRYPSPKQTVFLATREPLWQSLFRDKRNADPLHGVFSRVSTFVLSNVNMFSRSLKYKYSTPRLPEAQWLLAAQYSKSFEWGLVRHVCAWDLSNTLSFLFFLVRSKTSTWKHLKKEKSNLGCYISIEFVLKCSWWGPT